VSLDTTMEEFVDGAPKKSKKTPLEKLFAENTRTKKISSTTYLKQPVYAQLEKIKKKHNVKSISEVIERILEDYFEEKKS
jgi:hypothetical protein